MEKNFTFADLEYRSHKRITRREDFLNKMERIVPWSDIVSLIKPYYYKGQGGRPATRLEVILRMYFLQIWFSLSDEALEDSIYDSKSFSSFMGVNFDTVPVPDATVLCKFRTLLTVKNLSSSILALVNSIIDKSGLIMHGGTIVDATIHEAPKSTRNAEHKRDCEMSGTKKHGSWHFGAKSHIGVDSGTGLVHSVEVTTAKEHDVAVASKLIRIDDESVLGDSGYIGLDKREEIVNDPHLSEVEYRLVKRPSSWNKLGTLVKELDIPERLLISSRQKVEYVFHVLKDIFKFKKLPYRGLSKNRARLEVAYANVNLYMLAIAGRSLCFTN